LSTAQVWLGHCQEVEEAAGYLRQQWKWEEDLRGILNLQRPRLWLSSNGEAVNR